MHRNQSHSCVRIDAEEHLVDTSPGVRAIYRKLTKRVLAFGNVHLSPARGAILVKGTGTFLALKVRKAWLDIEFLLEEPVEEYPVYKRVRASKHRIAHFVRLEHPHEVTAKLLTWLRRSQRVVG
jgi:hypothetical protein